MEDNFRAKMDKIFGALSSSSTASTSLPPTSLWYLADDKVCNRNEQSRENKAWGPSPYQFDLSRSFPDDLSVDGDEETPSSVSHKLKDINGEDWREIKTSIGMDSTLDSEEEEDENDLVASGQELYSRTDDVNDDKGYGSSSETEDLSGIADCMRSPTKYTRYTFDECEEVDEESSRREYMEYLYMLRITEPMPWKTIEEINAMEEDETETAINVTTRHHRQYRARYKIKRDE
ncbi:unnamed protein product [Microthlaspi erraticum]|uniref:U5 small nuclear ribonucleoprotein TSSC4 n=1 Tax=Microthlaspi erraticum TaxID=1685480 RepID=A0A6D2K9B7_9BRAS|nr:unnamed protein product [Microthlaspi erraticum]